MSDCDYICDGCGRVIDGSGSDPFHTRHGLWSAPGGISQHYHPGCYEAQQERLSPIRKGTP